MIGMGMGLYACGLTQGCMIGMGMGLWERERTDD